MNLRSEMEDMVKIIWVFRWEAKYGHFPLYGNVNGGMQFTRSTEHYLW